MMKRIIAVVLGLIMLMSCFVVSATTMTTSITTTATADEPAAWAKDMVEALKAKGIIKEELFKNYKQAIPRKEFAYLLSVLYEQLNGTKLEDCPPVAEVQTFTDIDEADADYIYACAKAGIILGHGDGTFKPEDSLTREQMVAMVMRTVRLLDCEIDVTVDGAQMFEDESKIATWFVLDAKQALKLGIVKGTSTETVMLSPKDTYSKQEAFQVFTNMMNNEAFNVKAKQLIGEGRAMVRFSSIGTTNFYVNKATKFVNPILYETFYTITNEDTGYNLLTEKEEIIGLMVEKDTIYYVMKDATVKTVNVAGSEMGTSTTAIKAKELTVAANRIVYVDNTTGYLKAIAKADIADASKAEVLLEENISNINYFGGKIFYRNAENQLMAFDMTTKTATKAYDQAIGEYTISNGIAVAIRIEDAKTITINLQTAEIEELAIEATKALIVDGYIAFISSTLDVFDQPGVKKVLCVIKQGVEGAEERIYYSAGVEDIEVSNGTLMYITSTTGDYVFFTDVAASLEAGPR